jgi:hypothetical protein
MPTTRQCYTKTCIYVPDFQQFGTQDTYTVCPHKEDLPACAGVSKRFFILQNWINYRAVCSSPPLIRPHLLVDLQEGCLLCRGDLVIFYYLGTSEIWPDKKVGL